jgi:hypothetical protein
MACTHNITFVNYGFLRDAPDSVFAGYPANQKAGYRISGRISGKGRIPDIRPDIRPDTWLDNYIFW